MSFNDILLLLGDDQILDLVVGSLRNNLLFYQIGFGLVRTAVDDLLRIFLANARQRIQTDPWSPNSDRPDPRPALRSLPEFFSARIVERLTPVPCPRSTKSRTIPPRSVSCDSLSLSLLSLFSLSWILCTRPLLLRIPS